MKQNVYDFLAEEAAIGRRLADRIIQQAGVNGGASLARSVRLL